MLDYPGLLAVAAVAETGSFEKAAARLNVTPSAVSQRVRQLEERLGTVLIARGQPNRATQAGEWFCRHLEQVTLLERDLLQQMPGLSFGGLSERPVTLHVATNADSLGTWFLEAVADYAGMSGDLFDIAVDDEEHTADWLQQGKVVAAVTSSSHAIAGCRRLALGAMRYRATARADFLALHFPQGCTADSLARAPALTFSRKDRLQSQWIASVIGREIDHPTHFLPSTQGFVEACLAGMGWCLNPDHLVRDHLASGRLVELLPGQVHDVPLFWQINRFSAERLAGLTAKVRQAASRHLIAPAVEATG